MESFIYCPLTGLIYNEPVITEYGFTFEKNAINEYYKTSNKCPVSEKIGQMSDNITGFFSNKRQCI